MSNEEPKEDECKCMRIVGHLEAVQWLLWPRQYKPSAGYLALGDWTANPYIWLHCVESSDGLLPDDDVLMSTDTRYWSIHDVQRYFYGDMHCEKVLFTYQYPNLRMSTPLGSYFWRANTALKLPPALYQREFKRSLEITLKKMEAEQVQIDRLIISDQLINLDRLDHFKRKTFFRILLNIISFQDRLQLVSLENLSCKRIEGSRLIQQLACFNANTLKYLFLWRFVLCNENPSLINYSYITGDSTQRVIRFNYNAAYNNIPFSRRKARSLTRTVAKTTITLKYHYHGNAFIYFNPKNMIMTTDEEKSRIAKILHGIEVPDIKLSDRCSDLIKDFHQKFDKQIEEEEPAQVDEVYENPYRVDRKLLEENERKLRELLSESKRAKKQCVGSVVLTGADPKRPWRTNSNKEKLLRIDAELKQHIEKASQMISPLGDEEMKELVEECQQETMSAPPVSTDRLRDTVDAARKNLANFQYRKVENSTATAIFRDAHVLDNKSASSPITPEL